MAVNHYLFNATNTYGILLRAAMSSLEAGLVKINEARDTLVQMRDGDGSLDAHYTYITARFGFPSDTVAHAAFLELDSLVSKLNSDASQVDIHAALTQAFARFK